MSAFTQGALAALATLGYEIQRRWRNRFPGVGGETTYNPGKTARKSFTALPYGSHSPQFLKRIELEIQFARAAGFDTLMFSELTPRFTSNVILDDS